MHVHSSRCVHMLSPANITETFSQQPTETLPKNPGEEINIHKDYASKYKGKNHIHTILQEHT